MTPTEEQFQEIKELVYTDIIQNKIENYKTGNLTRTEFIDIFDVHIRRRLNLPENEEIIMNFPQCHALHKLCIGIAGEYWRQA